MQLAKLSVQPGIRTNVLLIRRKVLQQRASMPVSIVWILADYTTLIHNKHSQSHIRATDLKKLLLRAQTSRPRKQKMLYQVAITWQQRDKFCKFSCNGRVPHSGNLIYCIFQQIVEQKKEQSVLEFQQYGTSSWRSLCSQFRSLVKNSESQKPCDRTHDLN